jgi:PAS domain S-box-containing protein
LEQEIILNGTDDLVWQIDAKGNLIIANKLFFSFFEKVTGEGIEVGQSFLALTNLSNSNKDFWQNQIVRVLKGEAFQIEYQYFDFQKTNREFFDARFSPITKDGETTGAIIFLKDITLLKMAEIKLKSQEFLLSEINKIAKIGSWEIDLKQNIMTWSDSTKDIHELPRDYVPDLDSAINFYKEGESRQSVRNLISKGIKEDNGFDFEAQIVTAKGNERWVRLKGKVEKVDGLPVYLFGMIKDIDDPKMSKLNLEKKNQLLQDIEWMQSHVIRSPLSRIMGLINIIDDCESIGLTQKEVLKEISESAIELDNVISKISHITI